MQSNDLTAGGARLPEIEQLWFEILGAEALPGRGFLANGGDSFHAVLLAARLFELTQREVDYLDILEADGLAAVERLVSPLDAG